MAAKLSVTLDEYAARYGTPPDPERVSALLSDACDMLLTAYEGRFGCYVEGAHQAFDRGYKAVACSVVSRAVSVPDCFAGATQYSQTAGSYNASVTFANPTADLWLGKSDLRRLGMAGTRIGSIAPMIGDEDRAY
mgnify:CR=1 FL=1